MTLYGFKSQFQKNVQHKFWLYHPVILILTGINFIRSFQTLVFQEVNLNSRPGREISAKPFEIPSEETGEKAFNMLTGKLTLKWEHPKNFNLETSLTMRIKIT